jgi:hypothetical protein
VQAVDWAFIVVSYAAALAAALELQIYRAEEVL